MVSLKYFVSLLDFKPNGMSSIETERLLHYRGQRKLRVSKFLGSVRSSFR